MVKDDFESITPKLTTNVVGDNIQPKEIQSDIYINSPKLKIDKTFESNYKGEEERLKYTLDLTRPFAISAPINTYFARVFF